MISCGFCSMLKFRFQLQRKMRYWLKWKQLVLILLILRSSTASCALLLPRNSLIFLVSCSIFAAPAYLSVFIFCVMTVNLSIRYWVMLSFVCFLLSCQVLISQVKLWMLDLQLQNSRKATKLSPCLAPRYRILSYLRFSSNKYYLYRGMD